MARLPEARITPFDVLLMVGVPRKTSALVAVPSMRPAFKTAAASIKRGWPATLPLIVPLLTRFKPTILPVPTIVLLALVSVAAVLPEMTLFPVPVSSAVPPPVKVTALWTSNVVWETAPESLIEPALVTVAAASVSVPPSSTLTIPEFVSVPELVKFVTASRRPPAELIAVPPLKIAMSIAIPPLSTVSLPPLEICAPRVDPIGADSLAAALEDRGRIGNAAVGHHQRAAARHVGVGRLAAGGNDLGAAAEDRDVDAGAAERHLLDPLADRRAAVQPVGPTMTVPPLTVASISVPPERTLSVMPLLKVKPLKTSPAPSATVAPFENVTPGGSAVPPTSSRVPPLETVMPLTVAPDSTISVPPALTKLALAVPPDSTSNMPPPLTVVLVSAAPLATSIVPPLTFQCAVLALVTVQMPPTTLKVVKPRYCASRRWS